MNTKIKLLSALVLAWSLLLVKSSFAAGFSFTKSPEVSTETSSWVTISWEKLPWSTWYLVMYWTKSWSGWMYESELPDLTDGTWATIPNLQSWKTYYIAVSAFDSEFNEVSSPELVYTVWKWAVAQNKAPVTSAVTPVVETTSMQATDTASKFTMNKVEVVSATELKVSFSNDLNVTWTNEFLLTPRDNKALEVKVLEVKPETSKDLVLVLASALDPSKEYELVAVSVTDKSWNSIETWVDWMVSFSTPADFSSADVELNSASTEAMNSQNSTMENVWAPVTEVATNAEKLPQTWPREVMILALAFLLGLALVLVRKTRRS